MSPQLSAEVAERQALFETPLGPPAVGIVWRPTTRIVLLDTTADGSDGEPLWDDDDRREPPRLARSARATHVNFDADGIYRLVR